MYCWQQLQHQYEQFINAFLSLKAQFDPGLRCSYLNTMGDYHSPQPEGQWKLFRLQATLFRPRAALCCLRDAVGRTLMWSKGGIRQPEGRIRLHIVESKMTSLRISQFLIFGPTIGLPESCIFWGTN